MAKANCIRSRDFFIASSGPTMAFIEHMVSDLAVSPPTSPFTKEDPEKLAAPREAKAEPKLSAPKFELGTEAAIEPAATLRLEPSSESLDTAVAHGAPTTMLISLATQAAGKPGPDVNVTAVVKIQRAVRRRRCVVQRRIAAAVMRDDAEAGQRELLVRSARYSGLCSWDLALARPRTSNVAPNISAC